MNERADLAAADRQEADPPTGPDALGDDDLDLVVGGHSNVMLSPVG